MAMNEAAAISAIVAFYDSMKVSEKTNTEIATNMIQTIAEMIRSGSVAVPALGLKDSLNAPVTGSATGTIS